MFTTKETEVKEILQLVKMDRRPKIKEILLTGDTEFEKTLANGKDG
jgi:hypothetical protein